jgi:hypothetical protein
LSGTSVEPKSETQAGNYEEVHGLDSLYLASQELAVEIKRLKEPGHAHHLYNTNL